MRLRIQCIFVKFVFSIWKYGPVFVERKDAIVSQIFVLEIEMNAEEFAGQYSAGQDNYRVAQK